MWDGGLREGFTDFLVFLKLLEQRLDLKLSVAVRALLRHHG